MGVRHSKKLPLMLVTLAVMVAEPQALRAAARPPQPPNYLTGSQQATRPRSVSEPNPETQAPDGVDEALKKLSAEEQAALNRPEDPRGRVKTYVRLSWARLRGAREAVSREEYA